MNKNKKYAIRKLAVGIASVSIGMFISNTPEISQTLGSVGGVIQAFDNGTGNTSNETTKDWKPEGRIVATGEDGVPWELYENGYLLFKPVAGKDTLSNHKDGIAYWKTQKIDRDKIKAIGFTDKVYLPENSSNLFGVGEGDTLLNTGVSFLETNKIDTSKVKNMSGMFVGSEFTKLDLNNWNTSNVEDMSDLFSGSAGLTELKIDKWNTSKVKTMKSLFSGLFNLKELNIQNWDTSNVEDMFGIFSHMEDLLRLDLNKWNVSKVKNMKAMFLKTEALESLNIANWDTSNVENMNQMFNRTNLTELDISNWNTSKVKAMDSMFADSLNIKKLDLGRWNTSNVENMDNIFSDMTKLIYLDLTNWDTSKVSDNYNPNMFVESKALTHLKIGNKFTNSQRKNNIFAFLNEHNYGDKYTEKWSKLDKTTPFYTIDEWDKEYKANPDKLAGMWIREKNFRKDVRKIVDEQDKEVKESELDNYTEPKDEPDGVTEDKIPIYKVQKITTTYKGDDTLDKGKQVVEKDGKTDGNKVVRVGTKPTVEVEKLPSPVRYEKDNTREKGQENIVIKGKDGIKTTTTTYTVNDKTGEVVSKVGKPVVVGPTETVIKVAAKDKVRIVNKYDGSVIKEITTYEVNPKTGEITETKKEEIIKGKTETSKGTENPSVVENKDFVGGVNPVDSPIREALSELKVAIIKDKENNILDVIKLEEQPKEIKGYKNTGKTEVDKDGYKVYIYEKVENVKPETKETHTVKENKVDTPKEDNKEAKKEVINKKEELPKTSSAMLSTVGLFSIFGLRKNRKKDK